MEKIRKSLGQNFLIDRNKIIEISNNIPNLGTLGEIFLEVGPGKGALTKEIIRTNKLIAIEIDKDLSNFLLKEINSENLELIINDFLKVNLDDLLKKYKKVNFVSNLPYYISTKIIFQVLTNKKIENLSVMLQRELANRIMAKTKTKEYGRLTVSINTFFELRKTIKVSKECFYPKPKVDSTFLILKKKVMNIEREEYLSFLKEAFANKRKTILNSLKNTNSIHFENVKEFLKINNLSEKTRAEEISVESYLKIWNYIKR